MAGFEQPVVRCKDGLEALRYFLAIEPRESPHVILLDLHLPLINGLEVLQWLRHGHATRDIPVYLLTSSDDPEDRRRAMAGRVTAYLIKTPVFDEVIWNLDQQIAIINRRNMAKTYPGEDPRDEPFVLVGEDLYFKGQDSRSTSSSEGPDQ